MPVTICTEDNAAHEHHEVNGLTLNFGRHALQRVRAHLIGKRMSNKKAFHGAAARCVSLHVEFN